MGGGGGGGGGRGDPLEYMFRCFFRVINPPALKLKAPTLEAPSSGSVFMLSLLAYFLLTSGVIYDAVLQPPGMGEMLVEGKLRTLAFLPNRVNGQYIIEGLSAGFLFVAGGVGFMLLEGAAGHLQTTRTRVLKLCTGALLVIVAYNLSIIFLRIKVPGYLT